MTPEHAYIVGCQRSGTTLLRLVLESHPLVFCWDELLGYNALATGVQAPVAGVTRVIFKIPRWTEQLLSPEAWDEGESNRSTQFYRSPQKVIFLVRDPKAVVASMMKLRAGEKNWLETYPPRIMGAKIARDGDFANRYGKVFAQAQPVEIAALYWKYKSEAFFDYRNAGIPLALVRYESLVTAPERILRELCTFLALPWEPSMLHHHRLAHTEVFDNGTTLGETDPRAPIHTRSLEQWKDIMNRADATVVDSVTRPVYDELCEVAGEDGIAILCNSAGPA
jgi:hypothetical protein